MIKKLITEISEEDFRKLNIKVYAHEKIKNSDGVYRYEMVEKNLNDVLDEQIKCMLDSGYEDDKYNLTIPVTIAIHEPYTEEDYITMKDRYRGMSEKECRDLCIYNECYLDKFMNRFTGAQNFQLGVGIEHLYSTRDYYETRGDYWKVRKDETKVIYRVTLDKKWQDKFVLKHKSVKSEWKYNELPDSVSPDYNEAYLVTCYDLSEDTGEWIETYRYGLFKYERCEQHIPVDKDGHERRVLYND